MYTMNARDWIESHKNKLPAHELEWILEACLKLTRAEIYLDTQLVSEQGLGRAEHIVHQRIAGKSLQHLLGKTIFYGREFQVNDSTLIPRPETETLCEIALQRINNEPSDEIKVAELGLGTGCMAITILREDPRTSVYATEILPTAIDLAKVNALAHGVENRLQIFQVPQAIGFEGLLPLGPFHLIVSNPPYLDKNDPITAEVLKNEPHSALFPVSDDPMWFYENFLEYASRLLLPGGRGLLEVPHNRADAILARARKHDFYAAVYNDLFGRPRVLEVLV